MNPQIFANILRSCAITGLWIILIFLAYAPGRKILRFLQVNDINRIERGLFSLSIGLGLISFGIFLLGLAGLFKPIFMFAWISILAIWSREELLSSLRNTPGLLKAGINFWRNANYQGKGLIILSFIILTLTLLQALTPVWDYDGLMYHLEGPRQFLQASRIIMLQHTYQANGPMLIEMLYSISVSLGLEPLAKLIHMTYGILLILATYSLGERLLGNRKGWLPAAILLASPMLVVLAGFAYTDLGWALYTLLGMYSLLIWSQTNNNSWLISAGIFAGFMIGAKYLALGYFFIFVLILLWLDRSIGWRPRLVHFLLFGGIALLIGFPWYLKNWLYSGNPVFPLYFGGPGWPLERVQLSSNFIASFGTGKRLLDYLLLPINLYIHQEKFATFLGNKETISPLFIFVLGIPFLRNKSRTLLIMFAFTILALVYWAFTSQQIRLLLPLYPFFSILASKVLIEITRPIKSKMLNNILIPGVMGGSFIFLLRIIFFYFINIEPLNIIIGSETTENFLTRLSDLGLNSYRAKYFILTELDQDHKVLLIGDETSYYCNGRCIPNTDGSLWTYMYSSAKDRGSLINQLNTMGVTHFLINSQLKTENLRYFENMDDSSKETIGSSLYQESFSFLLSDFIPACLKEIYRDKAEVLYELTC